MTPTPGAIAPAIAFVFLFAAAGDRNKRHHYDNGWQEYAFGHKWTLSLYQYNM
jgi:hypothetical protein